ncbi:MAG TPA: alpha/beta hydrolase [Thermoleophilaceae bacterium]|nr:alpha/beta hydrolase [Thermoleophilaceae bacterium]
MEIAVRRAGAGPGLLLVHGIPTSSRLWDGVGADLAADFDVVAPDMLGYGESAKPADRDVSMAAQARLVPPLLDALGLDRVVLVGHDLGGAVAQRVVVEAPDRVRGLVLVDSVSFDSWPIARMRVLRALSPPFTRWWPRRWFAWFERSMRSYVPEGEPREALAASIGAWSRDRGAAEAWIRNTRAMDPRITEEVAPRLADVAVPAHVVWGERDPFQKVRWASRLRDAIPGATLTELDGGHFLPWDRPAEVAAEIRALAARAQS